MKNESKLQISIRNYNNNMKNGSKVQYQHSMNETLV